MAIDTLEIMTGKGHLEIGKIKFTVEPVYLDEVPDYLNSGLIFPVKADRDGNEFSDKTRISCVMRSFFDTGENGELTVRKPEDNPVIKWIEKKFYINDKPVKFDDIERVYGLSKLDIADMLAYLHEFSGF